MSLFFWRKPTPAHITPVQETSELERAILDDYHHAPDQWTFKRWQDDSIRSSKGSVSILSRLGEARSPVFNMPVPGSAYSAECGHFKFGPAFAKRWHTLAFDRLSDAVRAETKVLADREEAALRKAFLE